VALRTRTDELDTAEKRRVVWRVALSLSWFRQAAHEDDALFRLLKLWMAFEALEPVLRDHCECEESSGFQGLRALAEDAGIGSEQCGTGSEFISTVLNLRRRLFHALRVTGDELKATAQSVLEPLEQGLAARLGGSPQHRLRDPARPVGPSPPAPRTSLPKRLYSGGVTVGWT
jgi:hypothetical protein